MKLMLIAAILLGLASCVLAFAEVATTNDLHKQCEGKSEVERAYAYGYINGVVSTMHSFLFTHLEVGGVSEGDVAEAVCRYVDLHPETWSKEKLIGVADAVAALYSPKDPPKGTKKGK
ncbi:MAG TPA: Rap1a/Tai family immunity protein [Candidatus Sulfotelmatobacter sp.]